MDYKALAQRQRGESAVLYKPIPDAMAAFEGVMKAASKDGAVPAKVKELIAIATRCEGCIVFHVENAIRHGEVP